MKETIPIQPEERVVRVFVSSTFRDMKEERNLLVKDAFPRLRRVCEERGVTWREVDLRWGVSDEQKAEGRVLPICLEEIKRCRPYFIGILGERYGWVPDALPRELQEGEPWLGELGGRSVTELEILQGVLNEPAMAGHAFFYFRDREYLNRLPGNAEPADFISEGEDAVAKLRSLKERIRQSGFPVRENYAGPKELNELVYRDLLGVIDALYPVERQADPLDLQALAHDAYAQSRAQGYIGREASLALLEAHAAGGGPPLAVLGEAGAGKSALLANWFLRHRKEHPGAPVIAHFVGASAQGGDWAAMLRRIMGELKRRLGIRQEVPVANAELRTAFANWLQMAAARGRVVIVLDGLDGLEDVNGALDLVWLPEAVPANVRLFLSTLPGRPLDDLRRRSWPTLVVEPLAAAERRPFIEEYLAQFGKTLSPALAGKIAQAPAAASPLYLKTLLEELRLFGEHERLEERISHYLQAKDPCGLYALVLARWEEDYGERPGLVGDAMSLLWASRSGLAEAELLDMLGEAGEPLRQAAWSPLLLAAGEALVSRSGLLNFGHDFLRRAVQERYLPGPEPRRAVHERVAAYFAGQDIGPRKVAELPWQLAGAGAWQRLARLLAEPSFFVPAWTTASFDVRRYWSELEERGFSMLEAYRPVVAAPQACPEKDFIWQLAALFSDSGHAREALPLRAHLLEHFRQQGDWSGYAKTLRGLAALMKISGKPADALKMEIEAEAVFRQLGDSWELQACLHDQGQLLREAGQLDVAMQKFREAEGICERIGARDGLPYAVYGQGLVLKDRREHDAALAAFARVERLCQETGDRLALVNALSSQAAILRGRNRLDEALACLARQEAHAREIGYQQQVARALGAQGVIRQIQNALPEAARLHRLELEIAEEMQDAAGIAIAKANLALLLQKENRMEESLAMLREVEARWRALGNVNGLVTCLVNQTMHLAMNLERGQEALAPAEEAYGLARQHGLPLPEPFLRARDALIARYRR